MVLALPLAAVEPIQQLVLALPLAAVKPNTTTGPCTATCSRALLLAAVKPNTTTGPCTATCSRGANYLWSLHCHLQPWSQVYILQVLALLMQPWSPHYRSNNNHVNIKIICKSEITCKNKLRNLTTIIKE